MRNNIGVEEWASREVCDICDIKTTKFKITISNKTNSDNKMEAVLCGDCFEEFLVDCSLMTGNSEEEDNSE